MRDNALYILNLQRECQESDVRHKLQQAKYRQQQTILNSGIRILMAQQAYNTMAMVNRALRES